MTLCEFNEMNHAEQEELLWQGVLIGDRENEDHNILLYQIDSFYVECYYHKLQSDVIMFRSFDDTFQLEPYLKKINLTNLVNDTDSITEEDKTVMQFVADGYTSLEIATLTGRNSRTIESHIYRLKTKFNCKSLTHLAITLLREGLIK